MAGREVKKEACARAKKLLQDYYDAKVSLDTTFPYWYTRTWKEQEGQHPVVRRGLAFKSAFSHLEPCIRPGELLVMQRNKYVRGASIVPWTANRFPLNDEERAKNDASKASNMELEKITILGKGGGVVSGSTKEVLSISGRFGQRMDEYPALLELCRYWNNKSAEDTCYLWGTLHPEYSTLVNLKKAVLMSSDQEYGNRHGRSVTNFQYPLQMGFKGMIDWCRKQIHEHLDTGKVDKIAFWQSCIHVIEGVQIWVRNYAAKAGQLAAKEKDAQQRLEFQEIAERMAWIAENKPRNFMDAIQLHWTCQLEIYNEMQGSGFSPGRLGQVLYPFWKKDMDEGRITREQTLDVLQCMRVKYTELEIATCAGTQGILSGNTFNNVSLGGVKPDGTSAENELEYLFIEAAMRCATVSPTLSLIYDGKLSDRFLLKAIECNKTGTGYPAWVNNRVALEYCLKTHQAESITIEDARAWSIGGCLEIQPGAVVNGEIGAGSYSSSGINFINVPKILELVLWDGVCPRTGVRVFPSHGSKLETFDQLLAQFKQYFGTVTRIFQETFNLKAAATFELDQPIFLSALSADCIEKGGDIDHEGSRYNRCFTTWVTGQVNATNSLASIKANVYDMKNFTLDELKEALINNFGFKSALVTGNYSMAEQVKEKSVEAWDRIHALCVNAPKFGNDNAEADAIYKEITDDWKRTVEKTLDPFGRPWVASMLSVGTHGPLGQADIASADGRFAGVTLADGGQSPHPGTDVNGPYAVLNSATIIDHSDFKNTQLNMKMHPSAIHGLEGSRKMLDLIKAYMDKGGYHIQFNVVDSRMLMDAQAHPENYRDLMVRVAGFTQYWCEISKPIQDELIARTEYEGV
ncbi:MAG: pyruvate formate lyase family protein [Holophaga sp.]|nr:pyruvate formate lyase family protein [Holophaga sp.]